MRPFEDNRTSAPGHAVPSISPADAVPNIPPPGPLGRRLGGGGNESDPGFPSQEVSGQEWGIIEVFKRA
jgi:hypothetical protein